MTDEVIDGVNSHHFSRTKWGGKRKLNESSKYRGPEERLKQALNEWQITFDSSKDLIMFVDVEFRIIRANLATSLFLGKDLNEISGKTCFQLIHGSDVPPDICPLKKAKKTKKHEKIEFYLAERDMWLLVTVDPLLDHKGNMTGAVHIIKDITERKKVEKEVHLQSEIIMNMNEGVNLTRADDLVIVYTNPKFEKMFGYDSGELIGKHISVLNAPFERDPGEIAKEIMEVTEEKGMWEGEVRNIKKDGTIFWSLANVSMFDHPDYRRVFVSVQTDITERKRIEEEKDTLLKAIETAKEAINIADVDGKMIYTNDAMDELFGYKKGELIGKYPPILNAGPNPEAGTKQIRDAIERDGVWEGEIHNKRKDDTGFISYARISSVKDKHGRIINFVSTQHDVTERKKAEEALKESKEKFKNIAENSPNMIFINNIDRIVYVNKKCEEITGYTKEKFYSPDFDFLELIAPESKNTIKAFFKRHVQGGEVVPYEHIIVTKRGKRISTITTTKLIKYEGKRAILGIVTDITDRKKAEEKLRESEERYRAIFEQAAGSIVLVDGETGALVEFNDRAHESLGYIKEEFQKLKIPDFEIIESAEEVARHIAKIIREGSDTFETKHKTKGGEIRDVLVSSRVVSISGRDFIQSMWRDITERKRAEQKLADAYQKLKETQEELIQSGKMAAMGQLAAGISHELNQPLTGIKGFAQTILVDIEEGKLMREDVEKIIEQTDRMDKIIKNIRLFARKSKFNLEELNINQPIEDSLTLLEEQLRVHNIHLKKSLGEGLPKIKGDSNQLQQVFLNMITNAMDAIDSLKSPNSRKLIIKTTALSKNKENIEITFQDTGCGISKENLSHIFNPFFTTKSLRGGIGLGLSIAYRIIENHKGRIEVKSKEGKGTTFKITLPIL